MKLRSIFILLLFWSTQAIFSQDFNLSILTVPDSLKQNTNAIVRLDDTNIEMLSYKKMIINVKKAITVLNKKGNHNSEIAVYYDKSNHIKKLKIKIYDQFGIKIKEVKSKEIKDRSVADGLSLFNDNRLKYYKHIPTSYPYTISYEYVVESSNTAFIPRWYPIGYYNQSIQQSNFTFTYPDDITIKRIEKNLNNFQIQKTISDLKLIYKTSGIKAIRYEELSPSFLNLEPSLSLASNKFSLENISGEAKNWKEFGKWRYNYLLNGKDKINENTKQKIKELVKNTDDPIEKAKIVYKYVQNKTRYISVQEGIGGWKPIKADEVDQLGYGDCKGLTNYTKTLLDAAGVESHYSVIWAGNTRRNVEKDLFSMQGNHVLLYLPTKKNRDVWLECTSQIDPFGYQGTFTDDRDVLVIKPEGGEIKHTGIHNDKDSFQKTKANYQINADGSISATVEIQSGGIQYKNHFTLENDSKKEIEEHYKEDYWSEINNLNIEKYSFKNNKDSIVFKENLKITASDYATFSGNRLLFIVNAFNRSGYVPKRYRDRKLPLEISRGFIDLDHFEIKLPEGYAIEAIPENVLIENKFGKYEFSIEKVNDTQLTYSRTFYIKKGLYPKSAYKSYRSFLKKIAKYDKNKIVLIKK